MNPGGYAFVTAPDGAQSVFVPPSRFHCAIDGDEVEVEAWPSDRGLEGRVVSVVSRRRHRIVGVLMAQTKRRQVVELDDPRLLFRAQVINPDHGFGRGELVAARIVEYPSESNPDTALVEVERSLGVPGELPSELSRILIEQGIEDGFPDDVLAQAETVPDSVQREDLEGRKDLRELDFMTIDPDDARDFDDAVCVEFDPKSPAANAVLWVAVADVSHYVREGSAIDAHAAATCFSTYLPNRAIPMLPERLSSGICSLLPRQDRLAMVTRIVIAPDGHVESREVFASVIHSRERLTYAQVARFLETKKGLRDEIGQRITALRAVGDRLRARRLRQGAIELDLPETKILLDEDDPHRIRDVVRGKPNRFVARAYNLIEELMLAANVACATIAAEAKLPVPYRVHGKPDDRRLVQLALAAHALGLRVDPEELRTPIGVQHFVEKLRGDAAYAPLYMQILRAMAHAEYALKNVGHFALAEDEYLHFTSPIRRYPDLIAHRALKALIAKKRGFAGPRPHPKMPDADVVDAQCVRACERERVTTQAERDAKALFAAAFMQDRVGDVFAGTVTGLTPSGIYVALEEPFVDGQVRIAQLSTSTREDWNLDESGVRMIGSRSARLIQLGQRVSVRVAAVSLQRRQIELVFDALPEERAPQPSSARVARSPDEPLRRSRTEVTGASSRYTGLASESPQTSRGVRRGSRGEVIVDKEGKGADRQRSRTANPGAGAAPSRGASSKQAAPRSAAGSSGAKQPAKTRGKAAPANASRSGAGKRAGSTARSKQGRGRG